jgi:hypothetical protein
MVITPFRGIVRHWVRASQFGAQQFAEIAGCGRWGPCPFVVLTGAAETPATLHLGHCRQRYEVKWVVVGVVHATHELDPKHHSSPSELNS